MTNIVSVIEEIKDFALFQDVLPSILNFDQNIVSKLWTLELLTSYMNELVERFLASKFTRISAFFENFLKTRFDRQKKRQKYCFTFILSLMHFKEFYYYIGKSGL